MGPVWNGGRRWQRASGSSYVMRQIAAGMAPPAPGDAFIAVVHCCSSLSWCYRHRNLAEGARRARFGATGPFGGGCRSPSFVAFCASGPPIADDSEALASELQLCGQQLEWGRAQSGQRATVAPSETPRVDEAEQIADDGQYKFLLAWGLRMCVVTRTVMTARFNDCRTLVGGDDRPAAAEGGRGVCRESTGCVGGAECCRGIQDTRIHGHPYCLATTGLCASAQHFAQGHRQHLRALLECRYCDVHSAHPMSTWMQPVCM